MIFSTSGKPEALLFVEADGDASAQAIEALRTVSTQYAEVNFCYIVV